MSCDHSQLVRMPEVMRLTGLSRSTIYRMVNRGEFPAPVEDGQRAVAWRKREVVDWIEERPTVSRVYRTK